MNFAAQKLKKSFCDNVYSDFLQQRVNGFIRPIKSCKQLDFYFTFLLVLAVLKTSFTSIAYFLS